MSKAQCLMSKQGGAKKTISNDQCPMSKWGGDGLNKQSLTGITNRGKGKQSLKFKAQSLNALKYRIRDGYDV